MSHKLTMEMAKVGKQMRLFMVRRARAIMVNARLREPQTRYLRLIVAHQRLRASTSRKAL